MYTVLRLVAESPLTDAECILKVSELGPMGADIAKGAWEAMRRRYPDVARASTRRPQACVYTMDVTHRLGLTTQELARLGGPSPFRVYEDEAWWEACAKWGGPAAVKARKTFLHPQVRRIAQLAKLTTPAWTTTEYALCVEPFLNNGRGGVRQVRDRLRRHRYFVRHAPQHCSRFLRQYVAGFWTWETVLRVGGEEARQAVRRQHAKDLVAKHVRELVFMDTTDLVSTVVTLDSSLRDHIRTSAAIDEHSVRTTLLVWQFVPEARPDVRFFDGSPEGYRASHSAWCDQYAQTATTRWGFWWAHVANT